LYAARARQRGAQVQQAHGAQRWGRGDAGAPGGAGSPERSRAATTRTAAPRRPWPDPALALLCATCRRLLRAARRLPPARPMGGGRHSGAERRSSAGGKSAAPAPAALSYQSLQRSSSSRPAAARLPALRCRRRRRRRCRPASPGPCRGRGAGREEEPEVRAALEVVLPSRPQQAAPHQRLCKGHSASPAGVGGSGHGFLGSGSAGCTTLLA
jgi:hypothetical protein